MKPLPKLPAFLRRLSVAAGVCAASSFLAQPVWGEAFPAPAVAAAGRAAALPSAHLSIEKSAEQVAHSEARWRKRWVVSLTPLVASQSLDAASSYGMRELNPLLASSNGGFGAKAVGIKFGAAGGALVVEYLLVKKYPRSAKFFSIVNWSTAGITTGFAAHNYAIK